MARVIVGAVLESITGRLGTSSFLKYKGGHSLRRQPTNKRACKSPKRQSSRNSLARVSRAWSSLTSEQRSGWNQYATQLYTGKPSYDKAQAGGSGQRVLSSSSWGIMSGFNAFIRCNLTARSAGWSDLVTDAPLNIAPPSPITGLTATCNPPDYNVLAYWTNDPPFDFDTHVVLSLSIPPCRINTQIVQVLPAHYDQGGVMSVTTTCGGVIYLQYLRGHRKLIVTRVSRQGQSSSPGQTVITQGRP